jgi:methionine-rich copper-binding protein CopC
MYFKTLLVGAAIALAAGSTQAHAKLESAEPRPASTLAVAPKTIRLQFDTALEPALSKIALHDAAGKAIALAPAALDKSDPKAMTVPVPALGSGAYRVQWSTVTHDGHKVKGEFTFTVK